MSADGITTTDNLCFAAVLYYLYSDESLLRIEIDKFDGGQRATFHFHVPSMDADILLADFSAGQLAVSDIKAFWNHQVQLGRLVKKLNRDNKTEWNREDDDVVVRSVSTLSRPDEWWANARRASGQRRAEREQRERRERKHRRT